MFGQLFTRYFGGGVGGGEGGGSVTSVCGAFSCIFS